ncbi:MAG: tyrosine-type recombinase/integrase [Planctomycetota bacterium]
MTIKRLVNGTYQLRFRGLDGAYGYLIAEAADGSPTDNVNVALKHARKLSVDIEVERRKQEARQALRLEVDGVEHTAWPIATAIQDWLASYTNGRTRITNQGHIRRFKEHVAKEGLQFLHELTYAHARAYRKVLERETGLADDTKSACLRIITTFANWCVEQELLAENPFRKGPLKGFGKGKKWRRLEDVRTRYLPPSDRQRLLDACRTTAEKLMFVLCTYVGLRNAEVVHLEWGDYKRQYSPPELHIMFREPDEDDPAGWRPKTGERDPELVFDIVIELLDRWYAETPHGRADDDYIFVHAATGKRLRTIPPRWYTRLTADTGTYWTPQVGRRICCSIMPAHREARTGAPWPREDHEEYFGHSYDVAKKYYKTRSRKRVRRAEGLTGEAEAGASAQPEVVDDCGFDLATGKQLLGFLLDRTSTPKVRLATNIDVSDVAIHKFLRRGKSIPGWYWKAVKSLLRDRVEPQSSDEGT